MDVGSSGLFDQMGLELNYYSKFERNVIEKRF